MDGFLSHLPGYTDKSSSFTSICRCIMAVVIAPKFEERFSMSMECLGPRVTLLAILLRTCALSSVACSFASALLKLKPLSNGLSNMTCASLWSFFMKAARCANRCCYCVGCCLGCWFHSGRWFLFRRSAASVASVAFTTFGYFGITLFEATDFSLNTGLRGLFF